MQYSKHFLYLQINSNKVVQFLIESTDMWDVRIKFATHKKKKTSPEPNFNFLKSSFIKPCGESRYYDPRQVTPMSDDR